MQSATSDVNAGIIAYRTMLIFAIDNKNQANAEAAIGAINGILPAALKVRFDDDEYRAQTRDVYLIECPECGHETEIKTSLIKTRLASPGLGTWNSVDPGLVRTVQYLTCGGRRRGKACGREITVNGNDDRIILAHAADAKAEPGEPAVAYAPLPPVIGSLHDESLHGQHFWSWVRIVMALLENQLRAFRESVAAASMSDVPTEADESEA